MPKRPRKPGPIPTLKRPVQRWVQIEQADLRQAEKLCVRRGISFAALMRAALRSYLARQKGDE